jgi:hypothetical protein
VNNYQILAMSNYRMVSVGANVDYVIRLSGKNEEMFCAKNCSLMQLVSQSFNKQIRVQSLD